MTAPGATSLVVQAHSVSDRALDAVLDELAVRIQHGEIIDIEACAAEHPELADRLRSVLPAMSLLAVYGGTQSGQTSDAAHPHLTLATGVLGDFRLIREIGRGGMGVVYEAEQTSVGRRVALKVLPFASMLDERRLARFRTEVRAAGQLHHSNIAPIFAVGVERGVHFYAMQLIDGHSLADALLERASSTTSDIKPPNSPAERPAAETEHAALSTLRTGQGLPYCRTVVRLVIQAAAALEHAHSYGVIHRDVKPSNLLLDARGTLWLTDFGLARMDADSSLTLTGDVLGTLRYMSPEQTFGARAVLDHRTDIYSLGITLYELLTLRPAFEGDDQATLLRHIRDVDPTPPNRLNPAIPRDLETVVLKAIAKSAADRYPSSQEFEDDLRRFLERRPILARRPTLAERGRKWVARHAAATGLAAAALALIAMILAVATAVTLAARRSEAQRHIEAESNLRVAAESIDRMLSRVAEDHYSHGDLSHASVLATDAAEFYERLLAHSDDAELRLQAANAYAQMGEVWGYLGDPSKEVEAVERAGELIRPLVAAHPDEPRYLSALAGNYADRGDIESSLKHFYDAEAPWRQAHALWQDLATRFPDEARYQVSLARTLHNLAIASLCHGDWEEAKAYRQDVEAIEQRLPPQVRESPAGLCDRAATLGLLATLLTERGDTQQALDALEQARELLRRAADKWPTSPVVSGYLYQTYCSMAVANLHDNHHREAAAAVELLVAEFSQQPRTRQEAAELLERCALAATAPGETEGYRRRSKELLAQVEK